MHISGTMLFLVSSLSLLAAPLSAPQASPGASSGTQTSQAGSLIQQSLTALTSGGPITDVIMTGAYTLTNTSGTQNGTIKMIATASGQGQSTVTLPSGTFTEMRSISAGSASLTEVGPDGVAHIVSTQTALSPNPAWFCPALVLTSASLPNYSVSYVGQEILNGKAVQHLTLWWSPSDSSASTVATLTQFWRQVTQHDLYLDASTLLPVSLTFPLHPYDPNNPNKSLTPYRGNNFDGNVQLLFSDYQSVEGRLVAFHIHSTLKINTQEVISDIQILSVAFNTGATVPMPGAVAN